MKSTDLPSADKSLNHSAAVSDSRIPILIWIVLIYAASLIMEWKAGVFSWIGLMFFTGLLALHASLYWHSPILVAKRAWPYFIIQGLLIYGMSFLVRNGSPVVLLGLYPVLIGQSVGIFYQKSKIVAVSFGCYSLVWIALSAMGWFEDILLLVPLFVLMNVIVVSYGLLFFRQVHARLRTQSFLRELERTHRKVEELTLANERQRMARDLHDTLAQGLAGLLMQLEAADAHLDKKNPARAQEIIKQTMQRGRKTLSDARLVIDDLRLNGNDDPDFSRLVEETADKLTSNTSLAVDLNISRSVSVTGFVMEHVLHIIGESITNTVKHAEANRLRLTIEEDESAGILQIRIQDDGIGFNTDSIGRQAGHYGLVGIRERVRLLSGTIDIRSGPEEGTTITVAIPDFKGGDK